MKWLVGSSTYFLVNLGMSNASLVGMGGQAGSCKMGPLISFAKSGRFDEAKYGIFCGCVMVCDVPDPTPKYEVPLDGGV